MVDHLPVLIVEMLSAERIDKGRDGGEFVGHGLWDFFGHDYVRLIWRQHFR